jgi:hypothetical protein
MIVELRQYTLHTGQRDVLIDLFDREFVESQEALGIEVVGQFRDLDDPNRFVWLRSFPTMPDRAKALAAFYGGPVWKRHRDAANATMIDSDDVLLLRPARLGSGFALGIGSRPAPGVSPSAPQGLVSATIVYLNGLGDGEFLDFFEHSLLPLIRDTSASLQGYFLSETSPNTFRALPVRERENVLVWFASLPNEAAHEQQAAAVAQALSDSAFERSLVKPIEILRLSPTARSRLQYRPIGRTENPIRADPQRAPDHPVARTTPLSGN